MKIEIVWHRSENLDCAAQKGMSYNTTIVVDGSKHTISFIEYDTLINAVQSYRSKGIPFAYSSFQENGLAIRAISTDCIHEVVRYLVQHDSLSNFPHIVD